MPKSLSNYDSISLAVEAWAALVDKGGLDPYNCCNKRILIHAGSGGFGSIAIQLVKGNFPIDSMHPRNVCVVEIHQSMTIININCFISNTVFFLQYN